MDPRRKYHSARMLMLGGRSVGKTSLIAAFLGKKIELTYNPTDDIQFYNIHIGERLDLLILDVPYDNDLLYQYLNETDPICIVYCTDLTYVESRKEIDALDKLVTSLAPKEIKIILNNKLDLKYKLCEMTDKIETGEDKPIKDMLYIKPGREHIKYIVSGMAEPNEITKKHLNINLPLTMDILETRKADMLKIILNREEIKIKRRNSVKSEKLSQQDLAIYNYEYEQDVSVLINETVNAAFNNIRLLMIEKWITPLLKAPLIENSHPLPAKKIKKTSSVKKLFDEIQEKLHITNNGSKNFSPDAIIK